MNSTAEKAKPAQPRWRDVPLTSIVIPVRNDARRLETCLKSLSAQDYLADRFEVIVVDNGSTDDSREVAARHGAKVLVHPGLRVGALRNRGVAASRGEILAFIDSDHEAPRGWLTAGTSELVSCPTPRIAGSHYLPPDGGTWVQRIWALHRLRGESRRLVSWLGAGNFFIRRVDFDRLGGFNEDLVAAEDVDLCVRMAAGGEVICDVKLANIHHGEPAKLWRFFRKELWRGSSGVKAFFSHGMPWHELPSLIWPVHHLFAFAVAAPVGLWFVLNGAALPGAMCALAVVGPSLALAVKTAVQVRRPGAVLPLTMLYFVYALARALALFKR